MSAEDNDDDKQHEASQKKLDDARRKGEVPRSTDLITFGSYSGFVLASALFGGMALTALGDLFVVLIARADGDPGPGPGAIMGHVAIAMLPLSAVPILLVAVSLVAQQAFTVTGSKLAPKLSRISILSNAKNKFGRSGLFEFAKSAVKLSIYCAALAWFLSRNLPEMLASVALEPRAVVALMLELALRFFMMVVAISLVIGIVDYMWQRAEHLRKNRMSRKEMTDEHKESDGDPAMKQQRRQKGYDIAMNAMMADVPKASVVVVNPTHYAVALKWSTSDATAPVVVAKGVDEVAARIRASAIEAGVPIHSDPPTARVLHATVNIGHEISPEHFAPIAVAIRFAEDMRRKARQR